MISAIQPPGAQSPGLLDHVLASMLAVAISVPAFLSDDYSFKPLFYALIILPTLILLPLGKIAARDLYRSAAVVYLLAIPMIFWSASNLWSAQPDNFQPFVRRSLVLFVFVLVVAHLVYRLGRDFTRYLDLAFGLVALAAGMLLASLLFMEPQAPHWRLGDGTVFRRSLHASHFFGCFAAYGIVRCYQQPDWRRALPHLIGVLLCSGFVFSTESRGTIGSLVLIALLVSGLWYRRWKDVLAILIVVGVGTVLSYEALMARGTSYRLEIWQQTWPIVQANFWGGIGLGVPLDVPYGGTFIAPHAHNLYLDLLARSGVVGLLLLLPIVLLVGWRALKPTREEQAYLAMTVFFLLCMLTDVHKPINSPAPVFVIFWLPLTALLVTLSRQRQSAMSAPLPEVSQR